MSVWQGGRVKPGPRRIGRPAAAHVRLLPALLWASAALAQPAADPRSDPYFANPALRELMPWVTFQLTFDAGSFVPDLAAGEAKFTLQGKPLFAPGVKGAALVAGGPEGSGVALYPRGANAPLESRGAVALWVCDAGWTRVNGGNTTLLMTSNATFYVQRQGPLVEGPTVKRFEGLQYLMLSPVTGNQCLMYGTAQFPPGVWHLLVANWSWPTMSVSLDGEEFQTATVKAAPGAELFGGLAVGATGGEKTLLDELTIFRRPLALPEVRVLYEALRPK